MTPQERKLVTELFERLETLEDADRDEGAVNAINDGLDRAPNALYPLVQTVLVQDEALKRADARIRELEEQLGVAPPQSDGGFLDNMRDSLLGKRQPQGSVPSVRPGGANSPGGPNTWGPAYNQSAGPSGTPQQPQYGQPPYGQPAYGQPPQQSGGGSFLGTAAASIAGVVGGALLMKSFSGMFGGQPGQSHSAFDPPAGGGGAPWGSDSRNSDLAREAGLDDVGRGGRQGAYDQGGSEPAGLFDTAQNDAGDSDVDGGGDFGGDVGGSDA